MIISVSLLIFDADLSDSFGITFDHLDFQD